MVVQYMALFGLHNYDIVSHIVLESCAPIPTSELTHFTPVKATEAGPFRRAVVASMCAGSALMPAVNVEAVTTPEPSQSTVQPTVINLPPQNRELCPLVTDKALAAVDRLLARPEDPGALNERGESSEITTYPTSFTLLPQITPRQQKHQQWQTKAAVAQQTAQTLYDPAVYTDRLTAPLLNPFMPPLPFYEYIEAAQAFGDQYGLTIRLADGRDTSLIKWGFYPHSASNENTMARQGIVNVIDHLGGLTKEYVELTGVDEIVLYDEPQDAPWAGFAMLEKGRIALPIGLDGVSEHTLKHEFGHHEANATCGGAYNVYNAPGGTYKDPQFDSLAGEKFSIGDAYLATKDAFNRQSEALARRDYDAACQATQEISNAQQQIGAITAYGETDPGENKAEITSMYGDQMLYTAALKPDAPAALRQRVRIVLGRLYMASKNTAAYVIRLMPRRHGVNLIAEGCRTGDFSQWEASTSGNNGMK